MIVQKCWHHFHPEVQNPVDKTEYSSEQDEAILKKKMR